MFDRSVAVARAEIELDDALVLQLDEATPQQLQAHVDQCPRVGLVFVSGNSKVATAAAGEETLEFTVADDGPGVAPDVAENLFSGLVSTKGSKGTGLGLLVVHKIVEEHGGTVLLDRESGPGAVFRVRVPRWGKVPAA